MVGEVEQGKVLLVLSELRELVPLLWSRVYSCGVVSTRVVEDNGASRGVLDVSLEAFKVQATSVGIVVAIVAYLKASVLEEGNVVSPRGGRQVNRCVRLETSEELSCNT